MVEMLVVIMFGFIFVLSVAFIITARVLIDSSFIWDYKKIRVYYSMLDLEEIRIQLLTREVAFPVEGKNINDDVYRVGIAELGANRYKLIFEDIVKGKGMLYDVELQKKGSDTIVLVQYDRNSKARAVKYALLDSFIMKKMDVRLR